MQTEKAQYEVREAPLLSGIQTVQSIRDTGYKSTDYAIAELIDNAVDANASNVTVAIIEEAQEGRRRLVYRVREILVMDDGDGMTPELANLALSFGGSGHYNSRGGIGRFGMGLPQASVSQCRMTEIWSWQRKQIEQAHYTCLDLNAIESGYSANLTVPWPTREGDEGHCPVSDWTKNVYRDLHSVEMHAGQPTSSGTVVRWTSLDRLRWVRPESVLKHTEFLLGRIYRRFIATDQLKINILVGRADSDGKIAFNDAKPVRANDPMYLMTPQNTVLQYWQKEEFDQQESNEWSQITDRPPFTEPFVEESVSIKLPDRSGTETVKVRFSEALPESRPGKDAGSYTHLGRNAKENRGISMIRHGRELLLEKTLVNEAVDRWWGVEVEFPPALDEVFGVTNNKQDTPYFTTALRYVLDNDSSPEKAMEEGLFDEDDSVSELYTMAYKIRKKIGRIKASSKARKSQRKNNTRKPAQLAQFATDVNRRLADRHPTPGERERNAQGISDEDVASKLESELPGRHGISSDEAKVIADHYRKGVAVHFLEAGQSQSPAFFWPDSVYDDEQVYINNQHPAYDLLIRPLRLSSDDIDMLNEEEAKQLLGGASDSIAILLQAFSRLELEVQDGPEGEQYQRVREEWGRRMREIVNEDKGYLNEIFSDLDDVDI